MVDKQQQRRLMLNQYKNLPNSTSNHVPFCMLNYQRLFRMWNLLNAYSMQRQSPNSDYMAECDVVVAVRQFLPMTHCATLLNGNEHDGGGDVAVDEQIDHAVILIHLSGNIKINN